MGPFAAEVVRYVVNEGGDYKKRKDGLMVSKH